MTIYLLSRSQKSARRLAQMARVSPYSESLRLAEDDTVLRYGQSGPPDPPGVHVLNRQSAIQATVSKPSMAKFLRRVGVRFVLPVRKSGDDASRRFVRQYRVPVFDHRVLACFKYEGTEPWTNGRISRLPVTSSEVDVEDDPVAKRAGWLACRAIHALGLDYGLVSLGLGPKGVLHVLDVTARPVLEGRLLELFAAAVDDYADRASDLRSLPVTSVTLGTDIEIMLQNEQGKMVLASRYLTRRGRVGCDDRSVQYDGKRLPLMELRPDPDSSPAGLYVNLRTTMLEAARKVNRAGVAWRAGSTPFPGYSTGGHIHISGVPISSRLVRALDAYLGLPLMAVENPQTSRRRRPRYGFLGDVREKSHGGFEYRTPASFVVNPEITLASFCLVQLICLYYQDLPEMWLYDPPLQTAFYTGDVSALADVLQESCQAMRGVPLYRRYEDQIEPLYQMIAEGQMWDESVDVRDVWAVPKVVPTEKQRTRSSRSIGRRTRRTSSVTARG